jgi:SSS family solute:Na+ symporter
MGSLSTLDIAIIIGFIVATLLVGATFFKSASKSVESFFVADRKYPWWLAGTSIVATTFAADTPLAVSGIVANDGISGNWIWWCWAIAHLTSTFFFARLWRRSGVITDAEITELRYGGHAAAWLRGLKAIYFGVFVNCLTMAWVIAAMVKISRAFFPEVQPAWVIVICVSSSVAYTTLGGFRGVVITDLVQFTIGMVGSIILAVLAVNSLGGMGARATPDVEGTGLLGALDRTYQSTRGEVDHLLEFLPGSEHPSIPPVFFIVLLIAGWWRYAEGNGYIVQRLASAKDEAHAVGASLWFTVAHNALRPWPWILVGLVGLVVFPKLHDEPLDQLVMRVSQRGMQVDVTVEPASLDVATGGVVNFTNLAPGCRALVFEQSVDIVDGRATFAPFSRGGLTTMKVVCGTTSDTQLSIRGFSVRLKDREMAYPLLMKLMLPAGLLGLVIASLIAAFMSTIDTHTNWGASYLVNDLYRRFYAPDRDPKHYVVVSRLSIVLMACIAGVAASYIESIATVWRFLIMLGAGLGSVTAARWYWSRVTPFAEFAAIGVTTFLAVALELTGSSTLLGGENPLFVGALAEWQKIVLVAGASLATWIPVALFGPKNDEAALARFIERVRPWGPGWGASASHDGTSVWRALLGVGLGLVIVFGTLFGIGELLLGSTFLGVIGVVAGISLIAVVVYLERPRGSSR